MVDNPHCDFASLSFEPQATLFRAAISRFNFLPSKFWCHCILSQDNPHKSHKHTSKWSFLSLLSNNPIPTRYRYTNLGQNGVCEPRYVKSSTHEISSSNLCTSGSQKAKVRGFPSPKYTHTQIPSTLMQTWKQTHTHTHTHHRHHRHSLTHKHASHTSLTHTHTPWYNYTEILMHTAQTWVRVFCLTGGRSW